MLLPGVGFDVVPTDCLAAHLKSELPSATHLTLAVQGLSEMSRGTMKTMLNGFATSSSGAVRENGVLKEVPVAHKTRQVDFGRGPVLTATVPWGDVATSQYSTGIPNVEVYMALPPVAVRAAQVGRYLGGLLALDGVQRYLEKKIDARTPGPDEAARVNGQSFLWGRVTDDAGNSATARLTTPEAYHLTVLSSLQVVEKVLAGQATPGFQTPSTAYGAGLVLELPGVSDFEAWTEARAAVTEPLNQTGHRPYPLSDKPWALHMRWLNLLFMHWTVPAERLRPLIPPGLELDTFDAQRLARRGALRDARRVPALYL